MTIKEQILGRFGFQTGKAPTFMKQKRPNYKMLETDLEMARKVFVTIDSLTQDPVQQQVIIELLCAAHCMRISDLDAEQLWVADALHKHVRQVLGAPK